MKALATFLNVRNSAGRLSVRFIGTNLCGMRTTTVKCQYEEQ